MGDIGDYWREHKEYKRELDKLFRAYEKAEWALIMKRDEMFPPGTKVKSRLTPDMVMTVKDGSFYPDQVNTDWGHANWRYLDRV